MFDKPLMIFDCDGVLIDSEIIYLEEEFRVLTSNGIEVDKAWFVAEFMALAQPLWKDKFVGLIKERAGVDLSEDEFEAMKVLTRERIAAEIKTVDGVEDMLSALRTKACVASSTQMQFLPKKLERTNLTQHFGEGVYSGDMVQNGKPAPDLFLYAAKQMGGDAENSIVIEDSVNGVRGGKAAGIYTIGFTGGSHCFEGHAESLKAAGADVVVPSHASLLEWLSENTKALA